MDINLTAPIAANVTIIQPWYNSVINAGVVGMSAIIGGGLTILAAKITQRHEARRSKLEELKKMYLHFMISVDKINTGNTSGEDVDNLIKSLNTIALLGSDKIRRLTGKILLDRSLKDPEERDEFLNRFYEDIVPLMHQEIKDSENKFWSIRRL